MHTIPAGRELTMGFPEATLPSQAKRLERDE